MTAYNFGRKGVAGGAVAPRRASLVSTPQPRSFQPMRDVTDPEDGAEQRRAAFLAGERARSAPQAGAEELPAAETEAALAALRAESAPPPTDRSLKAAYAIWFFLGLGGGHRFYLRRPITGAVQALLFLGCVGAVAFFQYYEAFAGLALSWLWYLADGIRLKQLHLWSGRE
jgi:TM2 domain-containing membrane protein YozV